MKNLKAQLLEAISRLNDIQNSSNPVDVFKDTSTLVKKLVSKTSVPRKDITFISNSLRGLIDGYSEFTPDSMEIEVDRILEVLKRFKFNLATYIRNILFKVPSGKTYLDLSPAHFMSLAKMQGYDKVVRNLVELKFDEPSTHKWVDGILDHLKQLKKTNKRVDWKVQLASLQALNADFNADDKQIDDDTTKIVQVASKIPAEKFIQTVAGTMVFLPPNKESGAITTKVVVNGYFNKNIRHVMKRLGYETEILANQYTIIQNAKCFGMHSKLVDEPFSVKNKVKINGNIGTIIKNRDRLITVRFEDDTKVRYSVSEPNLEVVENMYQIPISTVMQKLEKLIAQHQPDYHLIGTPQYFKPHYYWLYFEQLDDIRLKSQNWSFPFIN